MRSSAPITAIRMPMYGLAARNESSQPNEKTKKKISEKAVRM